MTKNQLETQNKPTKKHADGGSEEQIDVDEVIVMIQLSSVCVLSDVDPRAFVKQGVAKKELQNVCDPNFPKTPQPSAIDPNIQIPFHLNGLISIIYFSVSSLRDASLNKITK